MLQVNLCIITNAQYESSPFILRFAKYTLDDTKDGINVTLGETEHAFTIK